MRSVAIISFFSSSRKTDRVRGPRSCTFWGRLAPRLAAFALLSITAAAADKDKKFEPGAAASYASHQTMDKVTIAAVPYTSEEQASSAFGKVNPYKYGILPVLVVIQNDSEKALALNLKVEYVDVQNHHLDSMPASDVVLYDGSSKASWKVPGQSPLPIHRGPKKGPLNTWEIEGRAFSAKLVPAGKAVYGFFYFETANRPGSLLFLDGVKDAASGKDFLYFEVPFEK